LNGVGAADEIGGKANFTGESDFLFELRGSLDELNEAVRLSVGDNDGPDPGIESLAAPKLNGDGEEKAVGRNDDVIAGVTMLFVTGDVWCFSDFASPPNRVGAAEGIGGNIDLEVLVIGTVNGVSDFLLPPNAAGAAEETADVWGFSNFASPPNRVGAAEGTGGNTVVDLALLVVGTENGASDFVLPPNWAGAAKDTGDACVWGFSDFASPPNRVGAAEGTGGNIDLAVLVVGTENGVSDFVLPPNWAGAAEDVAGNVDLAVGTESWFSNFAASGAAVDTVGNRDSVVGAVRGFSNFASPTNRVGAVAATGGNIDLVVGSVSGFSDFASPPPPAGDSDPC
jgi:hypothetical protein